MIRNPRDDDHARAMLAELADHTHTVFTAHCLWSPAGPAGAPLEAVGVSVARVTMRPLSAQTIDAYIATGEPRGRAGAYAIQETGHGLIATLQGAFDTVVGLNVPAVMALYRSHWSQ